MRYAQHLPPLLVRDAEASAKAYRSAYPLGHNKDNKEDDL